ncbi:ABC transporter ATP-binding protein [Clostridium sp.]|jgi:ATP-binding cassette, subfamily B, bacterial|uniref:ABC transporter ATP-binding protein n=1 Tax=Clostridium sp. TaxID=1506 RepID=UPI0039F4B556
MGKLTSLLRLKPIIKKYRLLLLFSVIGMIVSSIVMLPVPYFIGKVLDNISIYGQGIKGVMKYIVVIAVLYALDYIISLTSGYFTTKFNTLITNDLRYTMIDKITNLPMSYLSNVEKGYLQGRISESESIVNLLSINFMSTVTTVVNAALSIGTMFAINYKLALVVLAMGPISFFLARLSNRAINETTKKMLEVNAKVNADCFEILDGVEDIKLLNGIKSSTNKFKNKLSESTDTIIRQNRVSQFVQQSIATINNLETLLILIFASILIINNAFTVGLYTTFTLYSNRIFAAARQLSSIKPTLKRVCMSIERIYEILDMDEENSGREKKIEEKINSIKAEGVSFSYSQKDKNVLNNIDFEIGEGEKVIISGENGAGKSTLIKILMGLYEPTNGRILINNMDIGILNRNSLREHIGLVSQNIFLFRGTVLDNILFGQKGKNREDVERLIKELQLEKYIEKLPHGLDTIIVQNRNGVSGGQAQIIAFIRAMLMKKDIIILDEPIANVDYETRMLMMDAIKNKTYNGIVILISHHTDGMEFIEKVINIDSMGDWKRNSMLEKAYN